MIERLIGNGATEADRRRIIRGTVHSFLIQGGSVALVFASNWWLVRSTDPADYGLYVHVFNWVSLLSVAVMGGWDDMVLAQLPRYIRGDAAYRVRPMAGKANRYILGASIIVGGSFLGAITLFPLKTLSEHRLLFQIGMAAVFFSACLSLNQMILQALNHIRLSQLVEKLVRPLLLIGVVGLFHWAGWGFDARRLVVLGTVVTACCALFVLYLVGQKTKRYAVMAPVAAPPEKHSKKMMAFFGISLLNLLSTKVTMFILPGLTNEADLGIFNICYRFADLLIFPFFLMHTVLPQLFAHHTESERGYTQSLYSESNRLMALLGLPLLAFNLFAGKWLLHLYGPGYVAGYTALIYISIAQFLFSLFGPANTILMMQDKQRYSAVCLLVYVLVLAATSRWLIPLQGITGGALAILISSGVYNILLTVVLWRSCGIRSPLIFFLGKPKE